MRSSPQPVQRCRPVHHQRSTLKPPLPPQRDHRPHQPPRASRILRAFLSGHAHVETFTIETIVAALEHGGPAARLMVFSIPSMVPMPGTERLVGLPALAVAGGLVRGRERVQLPASLLKRQVPRRALALAIHAILPILQRAERATKERWSWLFTPAARRVIGILVFLLAVPLAIPILGFSLPHAASMFTIALGMIERDGALVAIGAVAGIAALVFITARNLAPAALAKRLAGLLRDTMRRLTSFGHAAKAILRYLRRQLSIRLLNGRTVSASRALPQQRPRLRLAAPVADFATAVTTGAGVLVGV